MRERVESTGRRMVRGFMPDEHRELFEKLPYLFVGSEDEQGRIWASLLTGEPGFVSAPDAETLAVGPVHSLPNTLGALEVGQKLGLLGIEFSTRRRNRANGIVRARRDGGFSLHVEQSFGNCAQYIHRRVYRCAGGAPFAVEPAPRRGAGAPSVDEQGRPRMSSDERSLLSGRARALIERSDTFFIATTSGRKHERGAKPAPEHGLDVSHRGGPPGFVQVTNEGDAAVLSWPDFRGNYMFCTLGNLEIDDRAGLLFVDFETGSTLALTGCAGVVVGSPGDGQYDTGRQLRFTVTRGVLVENAVPLRWERVE
jgi:predicted pyridoxine 5'-phosphate oxidase superfamily flavin-nucleotide-binding protein